MSQLTVTHPIDVHKATIAIAIAEADAGGEVRFFGEIANEIVDRTDGIPLFVEEMTKAVLEAESEGAPRRKIAAAPSPAAPVPPSLHASLMARLDRLGPAKEVAQIGAAIGRNSLTSCWRPWRRKAQPICNAHSIVSATPASCSAEACRRMRLSSSSTLGARRGLRHAAPRPAPIAPWPHCRRSRTGFSQHGQDPTRSSCAPLKPKRVSSRRPSTTTWRRPNAGPRGRTTSRQAGTSPKALSCWRSYRPMTLGAGQLRNRLMAGGWWWSA